MGIIVVWMRAGQVQKYEKSNWKIDGVVTLFATKNSFENAFRLPEKSGIEILDSALS